jgi:methylglutaconyl-CoA hydratase
MSHTFVRLVPDGKVARVTLSRPEIRNAFNDEMIRELTEVFRSIRTNEDLRVVVLTGEGESFCAGADLNWMKKMVGYSYEENYQDSLALAQMLHEIYTSPKPVIGRINGHAIGGGTGLVAVCDIAIAAESAVFAFAEVKLGLTPATISPYLLKRMGERALREYFLTGERFNATRALELGLVDAVVPTKELDQTVEAKVKLVLSSGPVALAVSKELIREITHRSLDENETYTAEVIARLRVSEEGQDGMNAFLEKGKPRWISG